MTTRDWALLYARLGWRVLPVVPGDKRPLYKGWQRDATTDPEQIGRSWRREPGPNIGIVCGEGFDVFDIEAEHLLALRRWVDAAGHVLPATPLARTGRAGVHILVQPTGVNHGRDLHLNGQHIGELKSAGGLIVVAPSVTAGPYRWLRAPEVTPLVDAPAWLLALLDRPAPRRVVRRGGTDPRTSRRQLDALARAIARAGTGRRNNVLYWAMRRAGEEGIPADEAAVVLARSAIAAGLTEHEVQATIRSAYQAAQP